MSYKCFYFDVPPEDGVQETLEKAIPRIVQLFKSAGVTLGVRNVEGFISSSLGGLEAEAKRAAEAGCYVQARIAMRSGDPFGRQDRLNGESDFYVNIWGPNNPNANLIKIRLEDLLSFNEN